MRLAGLGVDVMALSRAGKFLKGNRAKTLQRLLTPSERKQIGRKKLTPLLFSKFFTAKEAFFKALGASWMGLAGFRSLDVRLLPHEKFRVRSLAPRRGKPREGSGCYFRREALVGAQVVLWE